MSCQAVLNDSGFCILGVQDIDIIKLLSGSGVAPSVDIASDQSIADMLVSGNKVSEHESSSLDWVDSRQKDFPFPPVAVSRISS